MQNNIPYMFDFCLNPVVHLLLSKIHALIVALQKPDKNIHFARM